MQLNAVQIGRPMKRMIRLILILFCSSALQAQVTVFWQPGFPTISSQPVDRATLTTALGDSGLSFLDLAAINAPSALTNTTLLVLPYGSAIPVEAWKTIDAYLQRGGSLLVVGGQALRVPVTLIDGKFVEGRPQDTYSRTVDLRHTYEVPVPKDAQFSWKPGYAFSTTPRVRAEKFFTMEGRLRGLGYMADRDGTLLAAPVIEHVS